MIYILEIKDKAGTLARKEYQACSLLEALQKARVELIPYPSFYINDIWPKGSVLPGLYGSRLE